MTLAERAATQIRTWLYDGTIGRDGFHSVPEMAERLGMSRSPVREGLLRLAEAGLVEFVPQRGFRRVRPTGQDIAEIFALRLALEPQAAARAAREGRDRDAVVQQLHRQLTRMREAATSGDEVAFGTADELLHAVILECSGSSRLVALIAELRDTTRLIGANTAGRSRSHLEVLEEHEPFVDAIADADPARAAMSMRRHLIDTGRLLVAQAYDDGDTEAWRAWSDLVDEDE